MSGKITATTRIADPEVMAWDTDFWNVRVGRAAHLDGLSEWAAENTVGLVCLLVDTPAEVQEAEERGFRTMDIRVTLDRLTRPHAASARLARPEDTQTLCDIARTAYPLTRFYADPCLDDDRCGDLYAEWTRSLCEGAADAVLVVDRLGGPHGDPVGYVTVNVDGDTSEIGLIAVRDDLRGTGFGERLVHSAVDYAHAHDAMTMQVVTQGRNVGALRTFERCGSRVSRVQTWLHKWYEGGAGAGRGVHPASADRRSAVGSESDGREDRA